MTGDASVEGDTWLAGASFSPGQKPCSEVSFEVLDWRGFLIVSPCWPEPIIYGQRANGPFCRESLPYPINVRLSAVRKMVGEARRAGMIGQEEAASLTDIPNISQKGTRLGNWLTREQAKELLAVPDRSTLKGKRD